MESKNIDTLCVQAGYSPKAGEPRVVPIVQSTTYKYETGGQLADLFDFKSEGYFYSRIANPTVAAFENKIAALEGGTAAVALSSGMSAIMYTFVNAAAQGDNIVACRAIYGGSFNLLTTTLKRFGIEGRFFDSGDSTEKIEALVDDRTKILYAESLANPQIEVLDFDKVARIARKHGILFVVDNTLITPVFCRPFEFGANIVIHSSSKYLDGHAVALGGVVVDGGNFDFKGNKRYPDFNTPDESYHGLVYSDISGTAFTTRMRAQLVRDFGAIMSPENAFLTNLGLETLALRMAKHNDNVRKTALFLSDNDNVEWVRHPYAKNSPESALAKKYFSGTGGMISFGIKGGREKAAQFMSNLKMVAIVTHVADVRSCVLHPASTTHRQMTAEQLIEAKIPDNLIRLSIGIENSDDIIADLKQALERL